MFPRNGVPVHVGGPGDAGCDRRGRRGSRANVVLAEGDVAAGRLIRPFKIDPAAGCGYFLVQSSDSPPRQEIRCFREWLYGSLSVRAQSAMHLGGHPGRIEN